MTAGLKSEAVGEVLDEEDLGVVADEQGTDGHVHGEPAPRGEVPAFRQKPQRLRQLLGFIRWRCK